MAWCWGGRAFGVLSTSSGVLAGLNAVGLNIPLAQDTLLTYRLSKHLASILKHLQSKSRYSVNNTKEFANFISGQRVTSDELIVSFDVVSLFTSIPVDLAISLVKRKLDETDDWRTQANLTQDQILALLSFVLKTAFSRLKARNTIKSSDAPWAHPSVPLLQS